jgi:hypothetical protein
MVPAHGTADAAGAGEEAHGSTITAVQCVDDPHLLTIVAPSLEAVGAPTLIAFIYRDPTVMPPLDTAGMAIEQETVGLHHPIDSLVIGPCGHGQRLARPP